MLGCGIWGGVGRGRRTWTEHDLLAFARRLRAGAPASATVLAGMMGDAFGC
jgi:hypothetical protein